jgi:hypothetical protein
MVARGSNGCGLVAYSAELDIQGGTEEDGAQVFGSGKLKNKDTAHGNLNDQGKGRFTISWYPELQGRQYSGMITIVLKEGKKKHIHIPYTLNENDSLTLDPSKW